MDRRLVLFFAIAPSIGHACMGIGEPDQPVRFAGQTNIVIWDAEREVEHFIRDARFETKGKDLGFIAPTPTRPEIEAVSSSAFSALAALAPKTAQSPTKGGGFGGGMSGGGGGGLSVVEQKLVAGYEATVLKASDGEALAQWLRRNGYGMPRYAVNWLGRYARAGWYVTAFKVAAGEGRGATGPVRMTFGAGVPFNPYSVPAENTGKGGLSLYYISKGDEEAKIGRIDPWIKPQWQAKLDDRTAASLDASLKLDEAKVPQGATVRYYSDPSFGRPGLDDVYFMPRAKPTNTPSALLMGLFGVSTIAFVRVGRRTC